MEIIQIKLKNKIIEKYIKVGLKDKIPFGKYSYLKIEEILNFNFSYIDFLIKNSSQISFNKEVKDKVQNLIFQKRIKKQKNTKIRSLSKDIKEIII